MTCSNVQAEEEFYIKIMPVSSNFDPYYFNKNHTLQMYTRKDYSYPI